MLMRMIVSRSTRSAHASRLKRKRTLHLTFARRPSKICAIGSLLPGLPRTKLTLTYLMRHQLALQRTVTSSLDPTMIKANCGAVMSMTCAMGYSSRITRMPMSPHGLSPMWLGAGDQALRSKPSLWVAQLGPVQEPLLDMVLRSLLFFLRLFH